MADDRKTSLPEDPYAEIESQIRYDCVVECQDKIEDIGNLLEDIEKNKKSGIENSEKTIAKIRCIAHGIKGQAASVPGFSNVKVVAHRLEDYLFEAVKLDGRVIKDIYVFLDAMEHLLSTEQKHSESGLAQIVRSLPVHFSVDDVLKEAGNVEVLVVMPKNVQRRVIGAELNSCGFRTSYVHSSLPAIEMAMHAKPDLIIISALVDYLGGLELSHMLRVPESTKNIPIILVTSFSEDEIQNKDLPDQTLIARKGDKFPSDFAQCIVELGLFSEKKKNSD